MTSRSIKTLILPIVIIVSIMVFETSCGIYKPSDARKVSPNVDERVQQAIEEGRGFNLGKTLKVHLHHL